MLPNRLNQARVVAQHGIHELSSRPEDSEQLDFKFQDDKSDKFKLFLGPESGYAFIEYTKIGKTYVLHHAETPEELRGRGIARYLAEKTFDHIIEQGGRIKIECTYLQDFFRKNEAKYNKHAKIAE